LTGKSMCACQQVRAVYKNLPGHRLFHRDY
jgi:hypothetical protein